MNSKELIKTVGDAYALVVACRELGIEKRDAAILAALADAPEGLNNNGLAARIHGENRLTPNVVSPVSSAIKELIRDGYVVQADGKNDRREKVRRLTDKGWKFFEKVMKAVEGL